MGILWPYPNLWNEYFIVDCKFFMAIGYGWDALSHSTIVYYQAPAAIMDSIGFPTGVSVPLLINNIVVLSSPATVGYYACRFHFIYIISPLKQSNSTELLCIKNQCMLIFSTLFHNLKFKLQNMAKILFI